jgi:hypothetical protein
MKRSNKSRSLPAERLTEGQREQLDKDAADIVRAMEKRGKRKLILDEKEFLDHGNILIDEMSIKGIPLSELFHARKGMLLQEAAFLGKLFSEDRWQKMGWKVELLNDEICCWPDKIEGGRRWGFRIVLFWKPKI